MITEPTEASAWEEITLIMDSMSYFLQVFPREFLTAGWEVLWCTLKSTSQTKEVVKVRQGHP